MNILLLVGLISCLSRQQLGRQQPQEGATHLACPLRDLDVDVTKALLILIGICAIQGHTHTQLHTFLERGDREEGALCKFVANCVLNMHSIQHCRYQFHSSKAGLQKCSPMRLPVPDNFMRNYAFPMHRFDVSDSCTHREGSVGSHR